MTTAADGAGPGAGAGSLDVNRLRADTGVAGSLIYFNNARISPYPRPVLDAMRACLDREFHEGWMGMDAAALMVRARSALGRLVGAAADEIAITQSATHAFNVIVNGISWQPGDNVVVTQLAYRSMMLALLRAAALHGLTVRVVPTHDLLLDPEEIRATTDERTRLVVAELVPTFCGVVQPLARAGQALAGSRAWFVVNAAQALGQLPIDVGELGCHCLFGTSRKWLRGPRGLGVLFVRRDLVPTLVPSNMGYPAAVWTAPSEYRLTDSIDRFHVSDFPYAAVLGLAIAAEYASEVGLPAIEHRNAVLGRHARGALASVGVAVLDEKHGTTGTVPIQVGTLDADDVAADLWRARVASSVIYEENNLYALRRLGIRKLLRLSLHYYNTCDEIDEVARLVARLVPRSGD